jgi:Peptidase family M13
MGGIDAQRARDHEGCMIQSRGRLSVPASLVLVCLAGCGASETKAAAPAASVGHVEPQAWCSSERDELKRILVYNEHSLPRFRVNGPLANLPAFARAFACAEGTPMVRREVDRCEVW